MLRCKMGLLGVLILGFVSSLLLAAAPTSQPSPHSPRLKGHMIIGHRGASGHLPEHTLEAYQAAVWAGADAIEPDLVSTKDGVLIARHENELSTTTDVATRFPKRKRTKTIDGHKVTGWFSEDLTWAEIQTLRAKQRLSFRRQGFNGRFKIPSFEQILRRFAHTKNQKGRTLGLVPELKHGSYFRSIGQPLEPKLLKLLRKYKLDHKGAPVYIQSFEVANLQWLHKHTKLPLIQLIGAPWSRPYDFVVKKDKRTYGWLLTAKGLRFVATYAAGIGPWKGLIWAPKAYRKKIKPNAQLVTQAHQAGLLVFAYTFRNEPRYLAPRYQGRPINEYMYFFCLGVDGLFSDFPHTASHALDLYTKQQQAKPKK